MRLLILALAFAAFSARAEAPERDDPRGRIEAMRLENGPRTPEQQLEILRAAESEAIRYGLKPGIERFAAVAGTAWVNIGPSSADFEINGVTYNKVDSGRGRKILVDPRSDSVVYVATSGGGVWKTYDALTPVTATGGPHWLPITDSIGSLSVGNIAMNPAAPDSLLLGLGDPFDVHTPGMLHSDDGGATWSSAVTLSGSYVSGGPIFIATSVRDIAFDPSAGNSNIVIAATDAGLFRSTEGGTGTNWQLVTQIVAYSTHSYQGCWSVAYAGPHTWLASCVDTATDLGKVWQSTDDGVSWLPATLPTTDVYRMTLASAAAASANGGWRVYLLAADGNGADQKDILRSDNAGSSWTTLNMTPGGRAPTNPNEDQLDLDFIHTQALYNQMIVVDPVNPDILFVGGNLSMGRSVDGGTTWTLLTNWLPYTFGGTRNTGGLGDAQYAHADWHAATIAHFGANTYFYGGNDGGFIRSIDTGAAGFLSGAPGSLVWEDRLNRGIVSHLIFSVATGKERASTSCTASSSSSDIVYGGFQDNGTRIRVLSGGTNYVGFNQIVGGDGFGVGLGCIAAGAVGSNLIRTYVDEIWYSDNGGSVTPSFTKATSFTPAITLDFSANFKMKIATDLTADRTYITPLTDSTGLGHVYRSSDGGHTWNGIDGTIHRLPPNGNVSAFPLHMKNVATHPAAPNTYLAVMLSRAYVTTDGGVNWWETPKMASSTTSNYLPLQTASFDPGDATGNTIWVGSKGAALSPDGAAIPAGTGHLFKCTSAASASVTCTPMSTGIPEAVPVDVVKVDPSNAQIIYVGTEIGMYRSTNGGTTFVRYGTGLPLVEVTDVSIAADGSSLRIATYGRGFWEIYPSASAPAGVAGNGDFDGNQVIDGYDLVREAAVLLTDPSYADYNSIGNLVGTTNQIDASDLTALINKLGGRP
jgi:hypothetical protein